MADLDRKAVVAFVMHFGKRRDPPCDDCDQEGYCTMNCSPPLFPDAAPSVSLELQLSCVQREILRRKRLYPVRVSTHRLSSAKAAQEIFLMEAVERTLVKLITDRDAGSR